MVTVTTLAELVEALMNSKQKKLRICVIGGGTNTFFGEELVDVLVVKISLRGISFEEQEDHTIVTAQAGEVWDEVVRFSVEKKLWGIENLSYIPGTVGAAPVQNIGAYGSSLSDVFVSLSALDLTTLNLVEMNQSACSFGYRDSIFKQEPDRYVIISVSMKLSKKASPVLGYKPLDTLKEKDGVTLREIRDLVIVTRIAKLPDYTKYPNTGSFFKNPVVDNLQATILSKKYPGMKLIEQEGGYKIPAAWLIEHVGGYKGVRVGDVGTWPVQPLVVVNYGQATAQDILDFTEKIIKTIEERTGIRLEREVNFVE